MDIYAGQTIVRVQSNFCHMHVCVLPLDVTIEDGDTTSKRTSDLFKRFIDTVEKHEDEDILMTVIQIGEDARVSLLGYTMKIIDFNTKRWIVQKCRKG